MAAHRPLIVGIPTRDLGAAERFAAALGFTKKTAVTGGIDVVTLTYNDTVTVVYHTHTAFNNFMPPGLKLGFPLDTPSPSTHSYLALTYGSKAEVDAVAEKAAAAGGKIQAHLLPVAELEKDGTYVRTVTGPDGHLYGLVWFNPAQADLSAFRGA